MVASFDRRQLERPGADGIYVGRVRRTFLLHRLEIFLRQDRREVHRHVGEERRLGTLQREAHGVIVDLLDTVDDILHPHVLEIRVGLASGDLVERIVVVGHPAPTEQHIVGVEVTRRLEVRVAVELHTLAQLERDRLAIRRNGP